MEDSRIIELYWQRSEQAIAETARKYGAYCFSIACRILGDPGDAEECVNDTYQGAWSSIPPHRPENLSTFLGKLTRRISLKLWRSRDAQKRGSGAVALSLEELRECIPDGKDIGENLEAKELVSTIDRFLQTLPKPERQVFVCRYWHGYSILEISRQFGFSKSKVESMLHRTRKKLAARLREEGYFDERGNVV